MKQEEKSKKSIYKIIQQWLTWQKTEVILTGLATLLAIVTYFTQCNNSTEDESEQETEVNLYKQEIRNFQNKIKEIIDSETFPDDWGEYPDLKMVKELNLNISECIYMWQSYDTSPYMSEIVDRDFRVSDMITQWYNDQYDYITKQREIIGMIHELIKYGIENDIPYRVNSKIMSMTEPGQKQVDLFDSTVETCLKERDTFKSIYNTENLITDNQKQREKYNKNKLRCLMPIDLLRDNPNYSQFDRIFYDMIADVVTSIASVIKKKEYAHTYEVAGHTNLNVNASK